MTIAELRKCEENIPRLAGSQAGVELRAAVRYILDLKARLREIEWSGRKVEPVPGSAYCDACKNEMRQGHKLDCWLSGALR